jgi:biopolymer transport protein ExbB
MNLVHVFEQGDAVLLVVFFLLSSMSVISWYLIFWKGWNVKREREALDAFRARFAVTPDWPARIAAACRC